MALASVRALGPAQLLEHEPKHCGRDAGQLDDELPVAKRFGRTSEPDERQHQHRRKSRKADERFAMKLREVVATCVGRRPACQVLSSVQPRVREQGVMVIGGVLGQPLRPGKNRKGDGRDGVNGDGHGEAPSARSRAERTSDPIHSLGRCLLSRQSGLFRRRRGVRCRHGDRGRYHRSDNAASRLRSAWARKSLLVRGP